MLLRLYIIMAIKVALGVEKQAFIIESDSNVEISWILDLGNLIGKYFNEIVVTRLVDYY